MKLYLSKEECSGCESCVNICPVSDENSNKPIRMKQDEEGFLYPEIDDSKCICCHACIKVCYNKTGRIQLRDNIPCKSCYALQVKDVISRKSSQSGGGFALLSDYVLGKDGVVYGATMDKDYNVVHRRATNIKERDEMRKSKYVQSRIGNVFCKVREDLISGKMVLFSGTPCQVEGLKKFLGNLLENYRNSIVLVDLICHGVPSPRLWKDYVQYMIKKYKDKPRKILFRDKNSFGWHSHVESLWFGKKKYSGMYYTNIFYEHVAMRPSCYNCEFTNLERYTDFTIGDCWGVEKNIPDFDDNMGTTLLMVNSRLGEQIFKKILDKINYRKIDINNYMQPQMQYPIKVEKKYREKFWKDYDRKKFEFILKTYGVLPLRDRVIAKLKFIKGKLRCVPGIASIWKFIKKI